MQGITLDEERATRVQELLERYLAKFLTKKDIVTQLNIEFGVEPGMTVLVWKRLEEQNPEFFRSYRACLRTRQQVARFNSLFPEAAPQPTPMSFDTANSNLSGMSGNSNNNLINSNNNRNGSVGNGGGGVLMGIGGPTMGYMGNGESAITGKMIGSARGIASVPGTNKHLPSNNGNNSGNNSGNNDGNNSGNNNGNSHGGDNLGGGGNMGGSSIHESIQSGSGSSSHGPYAGAMAMGAGYGGVFPRDAPFGHLGAGGGYGHHQFLHHHPFHPNGGNGSGGNDHGAGAGNVNRSNGLGVHGIPAGVVNHGHSHTPIGGPLDPPMGLVSGRKYSSLASGPGHARHSQPNAHHQQQSSSSSSVINNNNSSSSSSSSSNNNNNNVTGPSGAAQGNGGNAKDPGGSMMQSSSSSSGSGSGSGGGGGGGGNVASSATGESKASRDPRYQHNQPQHRQGLGGGHNHQSLNPGYGHGHYLSFGSPSAGMYGPAYTSLSHGYPPYSQLQPPLSSHSSVGGGVSFATVGSVSSVNLNGNGASGDGSQQQRYASGPGAHVPMLPFSSVPGHFQHGAAGLGTGASAGASMSLEPLQSAQSINSSRSSQSMRSAQSYRNPPTEDTGLASGTATSMSTAAQRGAGAGSTQPSQNQN